MSDSECEPDSDRQSTQSLTDDNQKPSDSPTAADTPAKGSIVCDTNGNRKRFNGKHWKQLCRREDCPKDGQREGLCIRHLLQEAKCQSRNGSAVEVNDLFAEELSEENSEQKILNELLFAQKLRTILNDFKSFLDISSQKLKSNLDSNELKSFEELYRKMCETLATNEFELSDEYFESLVSKLIAKKTTKEQTKWEIRYLCSYPGCQYWARVKARLHDHSRVHRDNNLVQVIESVANNRPKSDIDDSQQAMDLSEPKTKKKRSQKRKTQTCQWEGCGYTTTDNRNFNAHMNGHKGVEPYVCSVTGCGKRFQNAKYWKRHETLHLGLSKTFTCSMTDECRMTFRSKQALQRHQNSVHLGKPVVCDWPGCEYRCGHNQQLQRHTQSAHTSDKLFKCQFNDCRKTFKLEILLKEHVKRHTAERKHQCTHEGCGRGFKTNKELNKHIQGKHSDIRFRCDWPGCEFSTPHKGVLTTHRTGVHSTEFNFGCHYPDCDRRFKLKAALSQHLKLHENPKPYACHWPGCQYRCADSGNFSKHMKNHSMANRSAEAIGLYRQ